MEKLYKCNEKVSAEQINEIRVRGCNSAVEFKCGMSVIGFSKEFYDTQKPIVGDYLVTDKYGYKSILRKDVFEKDYSLVDELSGGKNNTGNGVSGQVGGQKLNTKMIYDIWEREYFRCMESSHTQENAIESADFVIDKLRNKFTIE